MGGGEGRGQGMEEVRGWEVWMILGVRSVRAVVERSADISRNAAIGLRFKFISCSSTFPVSMEMQKLN